MMDGTMANDQVRSAESAIAAACEALAGDVASEDLLVLVDEQDRELGTATKRRAHAEGLLHRAFSVVLIRDGKNGPQLLLTKRAEGKYHSGGLWTNSCCSHPRAGEAVMQAASRRVREELGCQAVDLHELGSFVYRAEFDNGLCEHELDHVLLGRCDGELSPDLSEVSDIRWIDADELRADLAAYPERFTVWAPTVFDIVMAALQ